MTKKSVERNGDMVVLHDVIPSELNLHPNKHSCIISDHQNSLQGLYHNH